MNDIEKAITTLKTALIQDKAYLVGWVSNIAMSYLDREIQYKKETRKKYLNKQDKHKIANQAAIDFLNLLCDLTSPSERIDISVVFPDKK